MKKAVQKRTVIEKKVTKIFINGKNTVAVIGIEQFEGHTGSTFF